MAKKMKPGQKRCPSCGAAVSGPRAKTCPKCGHEFNGKPALKAAPATFEPAKATKNGGDKPEISKAHAVREFLVANPGAGPSAVVAVLKEQDIDITPGHVSAIKARLNKTSTTKKVAVAEVTVSAKAAPAVVEKPATTAATITLEQVKKVAQTVKTLGGLQRATEVLEVIKEMGGAKKFKELAEAMTVTKPDVVVF